MHPETYDPLPNPDAVVHCGNARFTVLGSKMIRMEWAADGRFEDRASLIFLNRRTKVVNFNVVAEGGGMVLTTDHVRLQYHPVGNGRFSGESLSATFNNSGSEGTWFFGQEDPGNLGGATRSLDFWEGNRVQTPEPEKTYAANFEPIRQGLISRSGCTVIDDSNGYLFDGTDFSFEAGDESEWPWVTSRAPGERQDLYLLAYGDSYKEALGDYVEVAGRIPVPPRFTFGTWWSRYTVYSDQDILDLKDTFRRNNVPLDVFVIDLEWHPAFHEQWLGGVPDQSGNGVGFGGHSWNRLLFPEPERFLEEMHRDGLKVTLNLHPSHGVQPHEDLYADMAKAMGQDPSKEEWIPFDIVNRDFAENYMKFMHHPLEKQGVDFWWLDHIRGDETSLPGLQNVWWLNYVYFTDMARHGKRPLVFHRWAGLGSHRYPIQFSGDIFSSWDSLRFEVAFTAQSANVGAAYWSHDLGGHFPGEVEPELYARWVQFGLYSPVMRTHTSKNPKAERMIWAYPEPYSETMKEAFRQRYALLPYVYTEARRTYDSGVAFIRPLYYDWAKEDGAYTNEQEYLFGDNLIVAPVTAPASGPGQTANQTLWVPPGEWYDVTLGRHLSGPTVDATGYLLDEIPLLQRAGSIVPMQPSTVSSSEEPAEKIVLRIAPSHQDVTTSYTLYEDNGQGRDYQSGVYATTELEATFHGNELTVTVHPQQGIGGVTPQGRTFELELLGSVPPEYASVNGIALSEVGAGGRNGWTYDGQRLVTSVRTDVSNASEPITFAVGRPDADPAAGDGVPGALTRLRTAFARLNETWPAGFAPDALIGVVQMGRRLTLRPDRFCLEIDQLKAQIGAAESEVHRVGVLLEERRTLLAKRLGVEENSTAFDVEFDGFKSQLADVESLVAQARELILE